MHRPSRKLRACPRISRAGYFYHGLRRWAFIPRCGAAAMRHSQQVRTSMSRGAQDFRAQGTFSPARAVLPSSRHVHRAEIPPNRRNSLHGTGDMSIRYYQTNPILAWNGRRANYYQTNPILPGMGRVRNLSVPNEPNSSRDGRRADSLLPNEPNSRRRPWKQRRSAEPFCPSRRAAGRNAARVSADTPPRPSVPQ